MAKSSKALRLTKKDRAEVREILLAWRAEGQENPLLPANFDADGDGIVDSFGLDESDNVIVVHATPLEATVFVSEGDDVGPEDGS